MKPADTLPAVVDEQLPAPPNPEDPVGLFALAIQSKAGADTLERVMAVRRELRAERAQEAFETALSAFQSECPTIVKSKGVPTSSGKLAYHYAPLEQIEQVIRPFESRHGFNHTFDTDTASAAGWVIAVCRVTHRSGHSRTSTVKLPLAAKTPMMSDTQAYAAALTFGNRRALCNAFGLVIAGEDLDGASKEKPKGPRQATDKTRTWMLEQLGIPMHPKLLDWAHCQGYLASGQDLSEFPLEHVPTTPQGLAELRRKLEQHQTP